MAIKSKEEILEQINARIGEDNSDEAITLIEDITDTLDDFETRANGDGVDWKSRYEENDKEWRNKYKERFFNAEPVEPNEGNNLDEPDTDSNKPMSYADLFTSDN